MLQLLTESRVAQSVFERRAVDCPQSAAGVSRRALGPGRSNLPAKCTA